MNLVWMSIYMKFPSPPLSLLNFLNIQTRGRDINSPSPYLIFKTSKQGEGVTIPSTLISPLSFPSLHPLLSSPFKLPKVVVVQTAESESAVVFGKHSFKYNVYGKGKYFTKLWKGFRLTITFQTLPASSYVTNFNFQIYCIS